MSITTTTSTSTPIGGGEGEEGGEGASRFTGLYTTNIDVAKKYVEEEGYEPIEYSSGNISLVGEFVLDHHGRYSNMPSVAIRGQGELFGKGKHKYIINHIDADIIVAIAGLEGIRIPKALTELIAEIDVKGRHAVKGWLSSPYRGKIVALNEYLRRKTTTIAAPTITIANVTAIVEEAITILINDADYESSYIEYRKQIDDAIALIVAHESITLQGGGKDVVVALAIGDSPVGFEAWYIAAHIIVAYSPKLGRITIGAYDDATAVEALKSEDGLLAFAKAEIIGEEGWGGRRNIIGSPRGVRKDVEDAKQVFNRLVERVRQQQSINQSINEQEVSK